VLATTADDYFAPSLTTLSEWLGLRERVAGLTFLALGNGAADMFSVIAAVRVGATDLAVGALQGGSMCVTCVVTAGVLMAVRGGEVKASGVFFTDLLVNIISCIVIMVILSALPPSPHSLAESFRGSVAAQLCPDNPRACSGTSAAS